MNPPQTEEQDIAALCELGRASVQIVHDLKNQLNGLKLYATFLRKRIERDNRPADELEVTDKLIAGLEDAAASTAALASYGRPLQLKRQPHTDLSKLLVDAAAPFSVRVDVESGSYQGAFDVARLTEALREITQYAGSKPGGAAQDAPQIRLRRDNEAGTAIIEWRNVHQGAQQARVDQDLFRSFTGATGLRLALAAKVFRAHGGAIEQQTRANVLLTLLHARLPLTPQP